MKAESVFCRSVELAKDTYLSAAFAGWITGTWILAATPLRYEIAAKSGRRFKQY